MKIALWMLAGFYVAGFIFVFWIHSAGTPATLGLVLLRCLLWPLWIVTGIPAGTPLRMD